MKCIYFLTFILLSICTSYAMEQILDNPLKVFAEQELRLLNQAIETKIHHLNTLWKPQLQEEVIPHEYLKEFIESMQEETYPHSKLYPTISRHLLHLFCDFIESLEEKKLTHKDKFAAYIDIALNYFTRCNEAIKQRIPEKTGTELLWERPSFKKLFL